MPLFLIGMMGSGKSRVGTITAERLGLPFRDTDEEVVARLGESVSHIWEQRGEEAFREIESEELVRLAVGDPAVVATGGGIVLRSENVDVMRRTGMVVWLDAPPQVLALRVGQGGGRPLLESSPDTEDELGRILEARRPLYEAACHHRVEVSGRTPEDVAAEVARLWAGS